MPSCVNNEVLPDVNKVSPYASLLSLLALAIYGARCITEAYAALLGVNLKAIRFLGTNIFATLSWILALVAAVIWLFKSWRSIDYRQISFQIEKAVPVVVFVVSCGAALAVNNIFHSSTWPNANQDILVGYAFIQLLYSVFMTGKIGI